MFYSKSTRGFYSTELHASSIPADAVEISQTLYDTLLSGQSSGMIITSDRDGHPSLSHPTPLELTKEDVDLLRLHAYAHPVTGSDRFFAESLRMSIMGEDGWETIRTLGVSRFQEIKGQYPWPK